VRARLQQHVISPITKDLTALAMPIFQREICNLTEFVSAGPKGERRVSIFDHPDPADYKRATTVRTLADLNEDDD
jgi:hypothetical protein